MLLFGSWPDYNLKLTDFGVSRNVEKSTKTGGVGTEWYRAPEALTSNYKSSVDIYGFAKVMWECVAPYMLVQKAKLSNSNND